MHFKNNLDLHFIIYCPWVKEKFTFYKVVEEHEWKSWYLLLTALLQCWLCVCSHCKSCLSDEERGICTPVLDKTRRLKLCAGWISSGLCLEKLSGVVSEHEGTGLPRIPAADAARLHPGGSELSCRLPAELQVGDVLLRGLLSESLDGRTFEAAGHCPTTVMVRGAWCPRDRLVRADSGCLQLETKHEESCWIVFWQWRENWRWF